MGVTLKPVADPDPIIRHPVERCEKCERDLREVAAKECQRRQVFDLPHRPWDVTKHQAGVKVCGCGHRNVAAFPRGVNAPVQYGPHVIARIAYMRCYQRIPFQRIGDGFRDEWNLALSSGPVMRALYEVADQVAPIMERVRVALQNDPHTVCCDETGMRVTGKLWWFHVVSTPRLTWLFAHAHRGHEAMDAAGILPHRPAGSNSMHDGLKTYQQYPENAFLCNAHHERELEDAAERTHQAWATQIGAALCNEGRGGRRRRPAQTKTRNLLERLDRERNAVLRFLDDLTVPFTNNLSERDLRMLKTRQHISGSFRTALGAQRFATIRGYLQTDRKQGATARSSATGGRARSPVGTRHRITLVIDACGCRQMRVGAGKGGSTWYSVAFLPPYSPNLNLIERLWKFVKAECLNSIYYEQFSGFSEAITKCLNETSTVHKSRLDTLLTLKFQRFKSAA